MQILSNITSNLNAVTTIEVSEESDFGAAVGGVITLQANTTYLIRGVISCTNRLSITTSEDNVALVGHDRDKDGLKYTGANGAGDFITIRDVNFQLINLKLSSSNTTAGDVVLRARNYDAAEYNAGRLKVLTLVNCQFRNCYDVLFIEGFDLCDLQQTLFWYLTPSSIGCQFKSVSKLQISSCEFVRWFDEGTIPTPSGYATAAMVELLSSSFGATNFNGNILHPQQTQTGLKISATSTTGFGTISGNTFINIGLTTGAVSDFDYSTQNAYIIQANQGLLNGNAKGTLQVTGNEIALDFAALNDGNTIVFKPANLKSPNAFTNTPTFPVAVRVLTDINGNGTQDNNGAGTSFTYNNKNDGNFFVAVSATVEFDDTGSGGGLKNGFIECVLRAGDGSTQTEILTSIGQTEVKGFTNSLSFTVTGTAAIGQVFDVVFKTYKSNGNAANDRGLIVREFSLNGFQF